MPQLVHLQYGYDRSSNRTYRRDELARANSAGFDQLYGYDGLNRLTSLQQGTLSSGNSAISSPTLTQDWSLDQTGNWSGYQQGVTGTLNQTRTHNTVNEITGISETVGLPWIDPAHDANGNMTTIPQPEQLNEGYAATYDAWNRLVKLQEDDGAGGLQTVAEYQYDGLGRRTVKKTYAAGVLDETRHAYFSDQWQVLEERVDSGATADKQFVWGQRYIDDLVLRDTPSERLYALQDALFNVVALADDTGAVKERFAYQPYGESEELDPDFSGYSGNDYQWEVRFTGRELDLDTGLQLNRNRYLHQQLGRWVSRDPIGYEGGVNLYCRYGVTQSTDPFGLLTANQRRWARRIIAAIQAHVSYAYKNPTGLEPFLKSLIRNVVPKISFKVGGATGTAASALFDDGVISTSGPIASVPFKMAVHETTHALNWLEGRYQWDAEKDEAMGYGLEAIVGDLLPLKNFEKDYYRKPPPAPESLGDCEECTGESGYGAPPCPVEYQKAWKKVWDPDSILSVPRRLTNYSMSWRNYVWQARQSRDLTNEDYLDITKHTGVHISCGKLAEAYGFGLGCKLCCPDLSKYSAFE